MLLYFLNFRQKENPIHEMDVSPYAQYQQEKKQRW